MWERYKKYLLHDEELGLTLDISRVPFPDGYLDKMATQMSAVFEQMRELEGGAIANPDENRMVGHYWLRNPELAPKTEIKQTIIQNLKKIEEFVAKVHQGQITGQRGKTITDVLIIGIGGSSLGPLFVAEALANYQDPIRLHFLDNTDPDGMDRVLLRLEKRLDTTLTIVISKSGGTTETYNGMVETKLKYQQVGLNFAKHALGITQAGSLLDRLIQEEGWLAGFPMWDWVGGRTSVFSAVGLLPLGLQGIKIDQFLEGARLGDLLCQKEAVAENPAALLALMWYFLTEGRGGKNMVLLPYKDRLEKLSKYLQQLIMESLGKEKDLAGIQVRQGIGVFGNKGTSDQHSFLQQLLEGPDNFFVTFIQVLKDREGSSPIITKESTSGDYLQAFLLGTRKALSQKGRSSITLTLRQLSPVSLGALLAVFERTVSLYAFLVNINAYHQPAVELGKKAAGEIISLKNKGVAFLKANPNRKFELKQLALEIGEPEEQEALYILLNHQAANPDRGIKKEPGGEVYWFEGQK
ncbi:MAG: glucose-6-phosphate isomerase [Bacillota bacterium]